MTRLIAAAVCGLLVQLTASTVLKFEPGEELEWKEIESSDKISASATGSHWALIVAGSNGWDNYRHQADACHAYQIMKKNGIPEDHIVLMMYDDLAQNPSNPTKGKIINHPNGPDVYGGVKIDYKGEDVTPKNFLAVLSGNGEAVKGIGTGRVINSGPNDHVFVNFADHGAPGLLAFPTDILHAKDLMNTITSMYKNKKYGQLVFYVEACESGSMFNSLLPKNINVYATTAANPEESSYACYYDDQRETYLGDVYSVNWMEDSDKEDLKLETLHKQFQIVKEETNTSHVMEYGDLKISNEDVADFQGGPSYQRAPAQILPKVPYDAVPSEEVPLAILYHRLAATKDEMLRQHLHSQISVLLDLQEKVMKTMKDIVGIASRDLHQSNRILMARYSLTAFECYEPVVELFHERCFSIIQNDFARKQLKLLVNLCQEQVAVETIMESIAKVCRE